MAQRRAAGANDLPVGQNQRRRMELSRLNPLRNVATNDEMGSLHETFLVSAVTMILVIRTQLWLTNYPQLGGHGLHIAHLLWGGLFMVVAIGILLSLLGRRPRRTAAVLGGIGFGFFIDELGKFITEDNDYFFKPAAGIIYIVFIALFLVSRQVQRRRKLSEPDLIRNAMEIIGGANYGNYDSRDRARALALLEQADQSDPMVAPLRTMIERLDAESPREPSWLSRTFGRLSAFYLKVTERRWFGRAVVIFFSIWAALTILNDIVFVAARLDSEVDSATLEDSGTFLGTAIVASSALAAVFIIWGLIVRRRGDRIGGYEWIARGLLVSIFITQVFFFVQSQFGAVFGLGFDILLLIGVRSLQAQERRRGASP
jgi:hypothetical protein